LSGAWPEGVNCLKIRSRSTLSDAIPTGPAGHIMNTLAGSRNSTIGSKNLLRHCAVRPSLKPFKLLLCVLERPPAEGGSAMAWTSPKVIEICVGLEINSYACADI